jgi:hypothetical protein
VRMRAYIDAFAQNELSGSHLNAIKIKLFLKDL